MADYPAVAWTPVVQSTANDAGGDFTDALGGDYNDMAEEVEAIAADLVAAMVAAGGPADIAAMVTAIIGGYADGDAFFAAEMWADEGSADWSPDSGANGPVFRRAPSNGGSGAGCALPLLARAAASRGVKVASLQFLYSVTVAEPFVDVGTLLALVTLNGHGSAPTQAAVVGTYDANHDTPAKRKTIGEHTLTYTITVPAFQAHDTYLRASVNVDDNGGGTAAVDIRGAYVRFEAATIDGA